MGAVKTVVLLSASVVMAVFLGFTVSFVVSPDPTGLLPVAVGVVLTAISIPVFFAGIRRLLEPDESSS